MPAPECASRCATKRINAMTIKLAFAAASLLSMLACGLAQAQAPTATKPAAAAAEKAKPAAAQKPRTARSLECSKEADAKNVHGKERKKFMSTCKKGTGKPS
jgi:hypothetical protein